MITIAAINCTMLGGGAKVMFDIAKVARNNNFAYYTFSPQTDIAAPINHYYYMSKYEHILNCEIGQLTGYGNAIFRKGTKNLFRYLDMIKPDIIHIHGLHNWFSDYRILINYIIDKNIPVIWTQHDCWSFTGKCAYYTMVNCDKWKSGCYACPQLLEYPKSKIIDNSRWMYKLKKRYFTDIPNLTLVSVSKWLQSELKQSFLKEYPCVVIENGIDTEVFQYKESTLRERYHLKNKLIILGVASGWSKRKGLDDFIILEKVLKNENIQDWQIVLVGVSIEQKQLCEQSDILSLERTQNVEELVEWYSAADVFFNPSMEESFGLVTVEAMSCGTPVIVYDSTASPEIVEGTDCYCVKPHNIEEVIRCIKEIKQNGKEFYKEKCRNKTINNYNSKKQYAKYLELYEQNRNWG